MNTRTDTPLHGPLQSAMHDALGRLVARAGAEAADAPRAQWLRWVLAILAVFVAWKAWRGLKSAFWTLFGLGMAFYWTGLWHRIF